MKLNGQSLVPKERAATTTFRIGGEELTGPEVSPDVLYDLPYILPAIPAELTGAPAQCAEERYELLAGVYLMVIFLQGVDGVAMEEPFPGRPDMNVIPTLENYKAWDKRLNAWLAELRSADVADTAMRVLYIGYARGLGNVRRSVTSQTRTDAAKDTTSSAPTNT
jgi:hypothetical protein